MSESQSLENQVLSEVDLLERINVNRKTLDGLRREKGFPFVSLNLNNRVYLVSDVVEWLKNHRVEWNAYATQFTKKRKQT